VEAALVGVPDVWPANYNTPTQTVVAGTMLGLERAGARLREAGARRVVPLNVAAAFHTPLMEAAGSALRSALDMLDWEQPEVPVLANLNARAYADASTIPGVLERQLSSPVRWADCVRGLRELGCDTFWELGPKRALTGMMKELAPEATASAIGSPALAEQLPVP
jgi:[acyl-carrier-protein] S-malonyltransferase